MKIRNASRKFKTWISALWSPKPKFDWLQNEYDLMGDPGSAEMAALIEKREKLKSQKKRHTHIQAEIENLRNRQLRGEA